MHTRDPPQPLTVRAAPRRLRPSASRAAPRARQSAAAPPYSLNGTTHGARTSGVRWGAASRSRLWVAWRGFMGGEWDHAQTKSSVMTIAKLPTTTMTSFRGLFISVWVARTPSVMSSDSENLRVATGNLSSELTKAAQHDNDP